MAASAPTLPPRQQLPRFRLALLATILGLAFAGVFAKTIYLQFIRQPTLAEWAQMQQQDEEVLTTVRGDILDRNGQELAVGEERVSFYATPQQVTDIARFQQALALFGENHLIAFRTDHVELVFQHIEERSKRRLGVPRKLCSEVVE